MGERLKTKNIKISAKEFDNGELQIGSENRHKIWLVWSIARYLNGFPMIDLRAVATSLEQAEKYKKYIEDDNLNDKRLLRMIFAQERSK